MARLVSGSALGRYVRLCGQRNGLCKLLPGRKYASRGVQILRLLCMYGQSNPPPRSHSESFRSSSRRKPNITGSRWRFSTASCPKLRRTKVSEPSAIPAITSARPFLCVKRSPCVSLDVRKLTNWAGDGAAICPAARKLRWRSPDCRTLHIAEAWAEKPSFGKPLGEHLNISGREIAFPIEACVTVLLECGMQEEVDRNRRHASACASAQSRCRLSVAQRNAIPVPRHLPTRE